MHQQPSQDTVQVRLTLDVTYLLNGEDLNDLLRHVYKEFQRAIGDGLLTGASAAYVEHYEFDEAVVPEPIDEDDLSSFFSQRIEDGVLPLEDIPTRLARYGLAQPHDFIAEMRERIAATQSE
jgi:hypothetical protein